MAATDISYVPQLPAPFKPVVASEMCTANFDEVYTKRPALDSPGSTPDVGITNPFLGYTYSRPGMLVSQPPFGLGEKDG